MQIHFQELPQPLSDERWVPTLMHVPSEVEQGRKVGLFEIFMVTARVFRRLCWVMRSKQTAGQSSWHGVVCRRGGGLSVRATTLCV